MSKQLAVSSAFSVFAMAAFALFAAAGGARTDSQSIAGTPIMIEAPALPQLPAMPALPFLSN